MLCAAVSIPDCMLRNYYINREWMVSTTARRIYRAAALASLLFFFAWTALLTGAQVPGVLLPALKPILLLGVIATATTVVAMEYFLFAFDTSPAWKRLIWFCVNLFVPLGAAVYCLLVYCRSEVFKSERLNEAEKASA